MKLTSNVWVVLLGLVFGGHASAQLTWTQPEQTVKVDLGTQMAEAVFDFTNNSDHPVTIRSIQSGWDVTARKPARPAYRPGERGQLLVKFAIGRREGELTRIITVRTSSKQEPIKELFLHVQVPRRVVVEPSTLVWHVGEQDVQVKTIVIKPQPELKMKVAGIQIHKQLGPAMWRMDDRDGSVPELDQLIESKLTYDEAEGAYTLAIKPLDLSQPLRLPLELVLEEGQAVMRPSDRLLWVRVLPLPPVKSNEASSTASDTTEASESVKQD
ncbi:MAG: DUF1573 domain-containing protein [Phycisphaeraceae bacterium]|nr:DUF1573 domain-containing protein [Phycisphaeraceae bacterium]